MTSDKLMEELIVVFQNFSEINLKHYDNNYDNLNMNEVHTIDFIGKNKYSNLKAVTEGLGITKGAVTKITKRLENRGLISFYRKDDNKKEKYFKLEKAGIEVFEKHLDLHKKAFDRDKQVFNNYNENEKAIIGRFLKDLSDDIKSKM